MSDHVTAVAAWGDGRLHLTDPMVFHAQMRHLKPGDGEEFEVRVERLLAARTAQQNRAYWGYVVRPVHLYTEGAMSLEDVHRLFKAEFLPSERFSLADPKTGDVKLSRDVELHTTTRLTEHAFRDYMETCRAFAAEKCGLDMSDRGLWERFGIGGS